MCLADIVPARGPNDRRAGVVIHVERIAQRLRLRLDMSKVCRQQDRNADLAARILVVPLGLAAGIKGRRLRRFGVATHRLPSPNLEHHSDCR